MGGSIIYHNDNYYICTISIINDGKQTIQNVEFILKQNKQI